MPPDEVCERARQARDARFDGRFFIAVVTTGVYCRPICPARMPATDNVRFMATAAAAESAGYRPCKRCRPELIRNPGSEDEVVSRALQMLVAGGESGDVTAIATRVGLSSRQLSRRFKAVLGATPAAVLRTHRAHTARALLDATDLPVQQVALLSGFGSVRQCSEVIRQRWQCSASELRARRTRRDIDRTQALSHSTFALPATLPWDKHWHSTFLERRLIPDFESLDEQGWQRRLIHDGQPGNLSVAWPDAQGKVALRLTDVPLSQLDDVLMRVGRLFDLKAPMQEITAHLGTDPLLAASIEAAPGVRVPGGWSQFETAVRAILGQQVTVAAATTLIRRLVREFGEVDQAGARQFPAPEALAQAALEPVVRLPTQRANAIRGLAEGVSRGVIDFDGNAQSLREALLAVHGIGPWTADYIAMRAGNDPDAFPEGDLIVRRAMGFTMRTPRREVLARAERWRPWRAYAVMHLWRSMSPPDAG